jgi:hypothetical protein
MSPGHKLHVRQNPQGEWEVLWYDWKSCRSRDEAEALAQAPVLPFELNPSQSAVRRTLEAMGRHGMGRHNNRLYRMVHSKLPHGDA